MIRFKTLITLRKQNTYQSISRNNSSPLQLFSDHFPRGISKRILQWLDGARSSLVPYRDHLKFDDFGKINIRLIWQQLCTNMTPTKFFLQVKQSQSLFKFVNYTTKSFDGNYIIIIVQNQVELNRVLTQGWPSNFIPKFKLG